MRFKIKCTRCGNTFWVGGVVESDTNATVLDENDPDWLDACNCIQHEGVDFEIVDSEDESFED